jgi:hypothetical protein
MQELECLTCCKFVNDAAVLCVVACRCALQNWMGHSDSSPVTSEHLPHKMLVPNRLAREIIQDILP